MTTVPFFPLSAPFATIDLIVALRANVPRAFGSRIPCAIHDIGITERKIDPFD